MSLPSIRLTAIQKKTMRTTMEYAHHSLTAWYSSANFKFKALPYVKDREFCLMMPKNFRYQERTQRLLRVNRVKDFDVLFTASGMLREQTYYNFYMSVAKYDGGVPFTPYRRELRRELKEEWKHYYMELMTEYDFYLDIDGTFNVFEYTRGSAYDCCVFLNSVRCPYRVRYSGKGFHITIPYHYFVGVVKPEFLNFNYKREKNIYWLFSCIAMWFQDNISEMVDTTIYDSRRVIKVPFSVSCYHKDFFLCAPMNSMQQLRNVTLDSMAFNERYGEDLRRYPDTLFNSNGSVKGLLRRVSRAGYFKLNKKSNVEVVIDGTDSSHAEGDKPR